jgi:nitroimidazol reductase NimA-like FMN-containing flavoprotein (pyridoxamine 5'-phosphate oxidase superfamily)
MLDQVIEILRDNRLVALATLDPDGWPHCTMVGFAHRGTRIYFVIARSSQKMIDLQGDDRVSMAIGRDVINPGSIRALAIKARARPVGDKSERQAAVKLLLEQRPALKQLEEPSDLTSAVMVAVPEEIRLLDYGQGYGHSFLIKLDAEGHQTSCEEQVHDWGYGTTFKDVT